MKYRSDAWYMDGGANDEGWHHRHCHRCGKVTEHGRGEGCVPCGDRRAGLRSGKKVKVVGEYNVTCYPNGKRYCNCKGFKFRKTCKHINLSFF